MAVEERLRCVELRVAELAEAVRGLRGDVAEVKEILKTRLVYLERQNIRHAQRLASLEASRKYTWAILTVVVSVMGIMLGLLAKALGGG